MSQAKRPLVIAGNWKMHKTIAEGVDFARELIPLVAKAKAQVYLAVPFTCIYPMAEICKGSAIVVGAQNMHDAEQGAFTGEISARMLMEAGARFVILGHSERRHLFHESNAFINKKVLRALLEGLQPILCVGETAQERAQGSTEQVLIEQIIQGLAGVRGDCAGNLMLAYEPVWAVGSSSVATAQVIREAHAICRAALTTILGAEKGNQVVILYGGSVTVQNAHKLMHAAEIDGVLIGGAALNVDSFSKIVNDTRIKN